jgi:hypothetical protein
MEGKIFDLNNNFQFIGKKVLLLLKELFLKAQKSILKSYLRNMNTQNSLYLFPMKLVGAVV